ncbi:prostaglandin D2 receptor-like isoform X2 [Rhinatrema bivittatum]|uniref:prostaglandin D2 receptor-like isoform X2 n=1 Tax=Rhinatrema bivittatum TaxID=194408 RepID=UPI00112A92D9|nr:prostaglandin D2 receptor-like isoform X2 [Rhinatrema bivittatum]
MRREVRSGRDPGMGGTLMELYPCSGSRAPQAGHTVLPSAFIFGAGLLGNLIALLILWLHKLRFRRGAAASLFYVLVTGLTVTDLLGKCLVSPLVLLSYARNRTLTGLTGGRGLCELFAFSMAFFGLASTLLLLAMALERWLSLGRPYLYRRLLGARAGALLVPAVYLASLLFCGLPFLGFGHYEQYCPGTWCFFRTTEKGLPAGVLPGFSVLYGTVMGVLVLAVVLCNASVMRHLLRMYRRQSRRGGVGSAAPAATGVEEIDQFILLALMTVLFAVCSLPLTDIARWIQKRAVAARTKQAKKAAANGRVLFPRKMSERTSEHLLLTLTKTQTFWP